MAGNGAVWGYFQTASPSTAWLRARGFCMPSTLPLPLPPIRSLFTPPFDFHLLPLAFLHPRNDPPFRPKCHPLSDFCSFPLSVCVILQIGKVTKARISSDHFKRAVSASEINEPFLLVQDQGTIVQALVVWRAATSCL